MKVVAHVHIHVQTFGILCDYLSPVGNDRGMTECLTSY
jgi:hypothetical protein